MPLRSEGVERCFLGWDGPLLARACEHLVARSAPGPLLDLSSYTVVTPGSRAGRVFIALLTDLAERSGRALAPPLVVTPGEVVGAVFGARGEPASPLARRLAWAGALRGTAHLERLVSFPPQDFRGWAALGSMLASWSDELAGEMLRFEDVPRRAADWPGFEEEDRWACAAEVQQHYLKLLGEAALVDPAMAAMHAASHGEPVNGPICLVGVAELGAATRRALERAGPPVLALIFAPPDRADWFDEFGCVLPDRWEAEQIPIPEGRIHITEDLAAQADTAFALLASMGPVAAHAVAIGVPDKDLIPALERRAERYGGLKVRTADGRRLGSTGPAQLLHSVSAHLERPTLATLSRLVRHPDMERCLDRRLGAGAVSRRLGLLDTFAGDSLARSLDAEALPPAPSEGVAGLIRVVGELLAPLSSSEVRRFGEWSGPVSAVLREVYEGAIAVRDRPEHRAVIAACQAIGDALAQLGDASTPRLWSEPVSCVTALRLVLDELDRAAVPDQPSADAVELLGWLEVPLDPSPIVIVAGCNEGRLPSADVSDAMLPDGLRRHLGIVTESRRFARDIYLMNLVVRSRSSVHFIAGRRGKDGDPLAPSRLLLRTDPESVVCRVRRFTGLDQDAGPVVEVRSRLGPGETDRFPLLPVPRVPRLSAISVTAFRTYIRSPYQFYIEHVLGLGSVEEPGRELDAAAFGSLLHEVLAVFGASDERRLSSEPRIKQAFGEILDALVLDRFGSRPLVSVRLQIEAARRRLESLAGWQAQRRAGGWLIEHAEWRPRDGGVHLERDGQRSPFMIKGKIDRIERHESSGRVAILDYKTGDNPPYPEPAHRHSARAWVDLQLPLYRRLAAEIGPGDSPELGYVVLPADLEQAGSRLAGWTTDELASAEATAWELMTRINAGDFADSGEAPPEEGPIAALCGVGMVGTRRESTS